MGVMLAHVGGEVASAGPCWSDLGLMLPHLDTMLAHLKHTLSHFGPRLAQKRRNAKTMEKPMASQGCGAQVEAMLDQLGGHVDPSWGYVGPSWGYLGPS